MQKKMQNYANNIENFVFTKEFISRFRNVLIKMYSYESYMDFLIVPSIVGTKTLSYIPLIGYSDRDSKNIEDLLELSSENSFQIKVLDFDYMDFKENDTVTMRINIENKTCEELLMDIKAKYRKVIRNSVRKNNFIFKYGNSKKMVDDFYGIFTDIMYKHGTPVLGRKFFDFLVEEFKDSVVFYNVYDDDNIVAAYCVLIDENISYGSWGGIDDKYRDKLAGHFAYWNILKDTCKNRGVKIFDFGRSPYGSGGYIFKHRFGAKPVKIDIITSQKSDIYSKYSLASSIWKKLPKSLVDTLGPKLCKYLVDL